MEMERLSVQQKSPKQAKAKKKPIKVVYISNPMRVTADTADFRAVVQKLTGRDSDIADLAAEDFPATPAAAARSGAAARVPDPRVDHAVAENYENPNSQIEMIYGAFSGAHMQESFPAFAPSPMYYEPRVGGGFRSSDEM